MNKTELITAVADKAELSKKDAENAVNAMIDTIMDAVALDDKVQIVCFGTFVCRNPQEKHGKNTPTREDMIIPASKVPAFKAGKAFKDATNQA